MVFSIRYDHLERRYNFNTPSAAKKGREDSYCSRTHIPTVVF